MGLRTYMKTTSIPIPEASHSISKVQLKTSNARIAAEHNLSLKLMNGLSCSALQVNATFFLTTSLRGEAIVLKSLTNC